MSGPLLLGFAGLKGSGKDTAADLVAKHFPANTVARVAFADPLKRMALAAGYPEHVLWGPTEARAWVHPQTGVSARRFLQVMGTEAGRGLSPTIWIDLFRATFAQIQSLSGAYERTLGFVPSAAAPPIQLVLVTDVRFANEAEALPKLGGRVLLIQRPGIDTGDPHESERWAREDAPRTVDWQIPNDGTLRDLETQMQRVVFRLATQAWLRTEP
jgi:hypothetical protein